MRGRETVAADDFRTDAYSVVLFPTNSAALKAEKTLLHTGIPIKLIPVPRQLSSDCGVALRFAQSEEARLREILKENNVPISSVHPM
jgi:hypothetical protein